MLITFCGFLIYCVYFITNNADKLTSLEGYPRWYQEMVIKEAGRQAQKDQIKIITDSNTV